MIQRGTDGNLVLVEPCGDASIESEVETARAVVQLMYEEEVSPKLNAVALAKVW